MENKQLSYDNFGVYIWTSNQLMHCVPAWAYLFNKFWPRSQKVRVLGYNLPDYELPDNFEYISLGKQRGPQYWSDDIKEYFSSCEHECFYLTTEDGFIVGNVDEEILDLAVKIALLNPENKFSRFNLTADVHRRPQYCLKQFGDFKLIKAEQYARYRQSLSHSIWRKDSLLRKLMPNQSPWDFELDDARAMYDNLDVYATEGRYAIHCGHGYQRGKKLVNWYQNSYHPEFSDHFGLEKEDIQFIENKGWMPEI